MNNMKVKHMANRVFSLSNTKEVGDEPLFCIGRMEEDALAVNMHNVSWKLTALKNKRMMARERGIPPLETFSTAVSKRTTLDSASWTTTETPHLQR